MIGPLLKSQEIPLYQAEQRYGQALKAIQAISAAVSAVLDLDELFPIITEKAADIFDAPATSLMLWDKRQENLVIRAAFGLSDEYRQKQRIARSREDEIIRQRGLGPHVFDIHHEPIGDPKLVENERLYTVLATPLTIGEELIGILNVYSRDEPRRFNEKEKELATIFANHAAIAIHNAQLYQQATERFEESWALQRIAVSLAGTLELDDLLNLVMAAAMDLTSTSSGGILFWDQQIKQFTRALSTTRPNGILEPYRSRVRHKGGITRAIIDQRKPIAIADTHRDSRVSPVAIDKGRRALIGVPLVSREEPIGVLFVNSSEPRQFSNRQVALLETLASQAAVAIERARQYEELKRTKGLIGARTALAWMGMVSSSWRHAIGNYATTTQDLVELTRRDIDAGATAEKIRKRLSRIEYMVGKIRDTPITAPLQAEEGIRSVAINQLLRERVKQLWGREPYRNVQVAFDLRADESTTVRASPAWLRRAFDILIDNAVEAMVDSATRQLTIVTQLTNGGIELTIADTGKGIPDDVLQRLFQAPIPRPKGSKGLGVGLLMAHTIVQTYGGDIRVGSTGPSGTTMIIWLPVES